MNMMQIHEVLYDAQKMLDEIRIDSRIKKQNSIFLSLKFTISDTIHGEIDHTIDHEFMVTINVGKNGETGDYATLYPNGVFCAVTHKNGKFESDIKNSSMTFNDEVRMIVRYLGIIKNRKPCDVLEIYKIASEVEEQYNKEFYGQIAGNKFGF